MTRWQRERNMNWQFYLSVSTKRLQPTAWRLSRNARQLLKIVPRNHSLCLSYGVSYERCNCLNVYDAAAVERRPFSRFSLSQPELTTPRLMRSGPRHASAPIPWQCCRAKIAAHPVICWFLFIIYLFIYSIVYQYIFWIIPCCLLLKTSNLCIS